MVSLAVVAVFVLMIVLSSVGLVARDWQREVAVPDAPPTFLGPQARQTGTDPTGERRRQGREAGRPVRHRPARAEVRRVEGAGREDPGQRSAARGDAGVRRRPPGPQRASTRPSRAPRSRSSSVSSRPSSPPSSGPSSARCPATSAARSATSSSGSTTSSRPSRTSCSSSRSRRCWGAASERSS